ncbi:MAG: hypothetical protein GY787_24895 [Alteromonadales bacterium]|nr:hypothetical protein [Alteromonadales bacterium]
MNILRSPKKLSNRDKSFKIANVHTIKNKSWTNSTIIDVDIALKDDNKRSTIVRMVITEEDAIAVFTGLVKGYKDQNNTLEEENKKLKDKIEKLKKTSFEQLELELK